jgi:hypothetical protein
MLLLVRVVPVSRTELLGAFTIFHAAVPLTARYAVLAYLHLHTHAGQKLRTRGDSDVLHSALQNALLLQARTFEQFVLYEWYPTQWGAGSQSDPLQHSSVVQEVTPSRTGLHSLKSTAVVYRQRGEWEIGG